MKHVADIERRAAIMSEVVTELERQDGKWGVQNHDVHYWNTIITEELGESAEAAFGAYTLNGARHYVEELVHVAACAVQAIETLRRLHPEWDPQIEFDGSPKAILPRAENKGEIDDPDDFHLTLADQQRRAGG